MFGSMLGTEDTAVGSPSYDSCLTIKQVDTNPISHVLTN